MKAILTIFLFFSCFSLMAQREGFNYKELPPGFSDDKNTILVFITYTKEDAEQNGMEWRFISEYNDYVTKLANKIYTGPKKILTESELKEDPEDINYIFTYVVVRTDGIRKAPAGFGITDVSTGLIYTKNKTYLSNVSTECKGEIKHIEKLRSGN